MIFADSSYFIALADQKDQWHSRAVELSKNLQKGLLITDLILSECVTAIGSRGGGKAGADIYNYLVDNCQIIFASRDVLEKAMQVFLKYDGTLSMADSISIVVMNSKGVNTILSFDSDFDKVEGIIRLG